MKKVILWTLSTACNLDCKYCYYKQEERGGIYSFCMFDDGIDKIMDISPDIVYLSGEPTIIKETLYIIRKLKKKLKVVLTSNGVLIGQDYAESLLKASVDGILISLDGPDETTHNLLRSHFDFVIKGIAALENARKDNSYPKLGIVTVVHGANIDKIEEMVLLCQAFRFDYIHFQPIYLSPTDKFHNLSLSKQELFQLSKTLNTLNQKYENQGITLSSKEYINALQNFSLTGTFGEITCSGGNFFKFIDERCQEKKCPSPLITLNEDCVPSLNCINMIELVNSNFL